MAGLQSSGLAISHVLGSEALAEESIPMLKAANPANLDRWTPDIRHLLLATRFLRNIGCTYLASDRAAKITWKNKLIWEARRPTRATLAVQVERVRQYADQRSDRAAEILSQAGDFTPYLLAPLGLTAGRGQRVAELLGNVMALAGMCTMEPKHLLACRRPEEIDARVMPIFPAPGHGAYPSGHATQAFAMAHVAACLLRAQGATSPDTEARVTLLYRQAHRIAVNRTVAGVHYPMDSAAGAKLGVQIGRVLVGLMTGDAGLREALSHNPQEKADADFLFSDAAEICAQSTGAAVKVAKDPLFAWMWLAALADLVGPPGAAD